MKPRRIWLRLSALLLLSFLAFYFIRQPTTLRDQIDRVAEVEPSSASKSIKDTNALAKNSAKIQSVVPTNINPPPIVSDRQKTNAIRQYVESQNKPIEFYGLAVDQNNNPIVGVQVKVEIRQIKVIVPAPWGEEEEILRIEKETDFNGRFEINGVTGDSLTIKSVEREGYRLSPKTEAIYGYGAVPNQYQPNPQDPVIIRMWKLGESVNLILHRTLFGFQPDGSIYTLDLLSDTKTGGAGLVGDLQIRFQRPLKLKPKETYDWTLDISAVKGGLIETTDEFEYIAPEHGYKPRVIFRTNSIAPRSMPDLTKDFYFTSRKGQVYGVLHLQIYADYNGQGAILVDSRINPNRSRNLQP